MSLTTDRVPGPSGIFGPSHAIRWCWHVRDGVVSCDLPAESIHGLGGAPIWSKRLLEAARKHVSSGGKALVMVGDFRFGNAIASAPKRTSRTLFQDGFSGIDAKALTPEIDQKMLARGLAGVQSWVKAFSPMARFVFWDLFGRQVFDRLGGRHNSGGRYQHPVFNYAETVAQFPDADIVDLGPLLRQPMHEVRRLFIDQSCHPSQIGFIFLNEALCRGQDTLTAYRNAVNEVETALFGLARRVAADIGGPVLITGRSVWLETLTNYMGQSGALRLAEAGVVLAPLEASPGQPTLAQMMQKVPFNNCKPVVVSAAGRDISVELARAFGTASAIWKGLPVIDWEEGTKDAITARGETPRHVNGLAKGETASEVFVPTLAGHMVEQGPLGMPSWTGIVHLLEQIASGEVPAGLRRRSAAATGPAIKAIVVDALLTDEDVAFQIGSNHSVLKYATADLKPSADSLEAFRSNITARRRVAQSARAPYAHVIFPDKQSVLSGAFPAQPVHRLGELYASDLQAGHRASVLYPADVLRQMAEPSFLPLDTHLTDHGSLEVMRLILEALGIEAGATLDHIRTRISRMQRWSGDLGNKFSPPLLQESKVLAEDWPLTELRSSGGFNDGMIDILLNPAAAKDATLLLFGDSFFRMMLKQLSAVFSKVIHLRSQFLHPEMVALVEPDYLLTGNAERYLSDVRPDTDAHAFFLYPQLRGQAHEAPEAEFLAAWRAVTSPRSAFAAEYLASKGFSARPVEAATNGAGPVDRSPSGAMIEACYRNAPVRSLKHNTYFPVYERLFERFVGRAVTVVEIGILDGGSLFMWREFFGPSARIIGVELNPDARWLEREGFEIYTGSQSDPAFWEAFFAKVGPVDIMIDDGGHTFAQQIVTTTHVLEHIRDGGMLVVEDTHSSYMPEFGGPSPVSFIAYAKNMVDGINHRFSQFAKERANERTVWSLQFFESVVAFFVDRSLAGVQSAPTSNDRPSIKMRDLRHEDPITLSESDLKALFKY